MEAFYLDLFNSINQYRPLNPPGNWEDLRDKDKCKWSGDISVNDDGRDANERLSMENLDECFKLSSIQLNNLKRAHSGYVKNIRDKFDDKNERLTNSLFPNNVGIVTIGGGRYTVLLMTMIAKLRDTGTSLPIEVIIPPEDEGDDDFCNVILPKWNGKCVFFKDVLPDELNKKLMLQSYQIKPLAVLLSSFKKILFLDADNYAMKDLDHIFESEPFIENGLIVWPDYWRRVTPPAYYKIADINISKKKRIRNINDDITPPSYYDNKLKDRDHLLKEVPMHDLEGTIPDPTSESGQMVIDKVKHFHTLLLSLYYNLYGPSWYYQIFSQGTSGQGDKETFIAAAHALNKPYYQVTTSLGLKGFFYENEFRGIGLLQRDFQQDYAQHQLVKQTIQDHLEEYSEFKEDYKVADEFNKKLMIPPNGQPLDVMFVHASFYKYEPWDLYNERRYVNSDGTHFRGFSDLKEFNYFDMELFNFKILRDTLCSPNKKVEFKFYNDKVFSPEWDNMCTYLKDHVNFLQETHSEAVAKEEASN